MPNPEIIRMVVTFLPFVIVGAVVLTFASMILRIFKAGGFKNMLFGAPIIRTVGEVATAAPFRGRNVIKVHVLGNSVPEREIGLEFVSTAGRSYRMTPVPMSRVEAMQLISLLQAAAQGA